MKNMEFIKNYLPQIFIGFGVIFSFIGGIIIFARTNEYNDTLKQKAIINENLTNENLNLTKDNKTLITQNIEMTTLNGNLIQKNLELSEQNIQLSNNIKEQSEIINSNITGGDSFCHLQLSYAGINNFNIVLVNEGNFPMSKIQVRIVDLDELHATKIHTLESLTKNTFNVDELSGKMAQIIGNLQLTPQTNEVNLNIFINAKNGNFIQLSRLRKFDNVWHFANRVKKGDQILLEKIDEKFPVKTPDEIWKE